MNQRQVMGQAVDLERMAHAKEVAQMKHRSQIYSLATSIMVKNSELAIYSSGFIDDTTKERFLERKELVQQSLDLAEEMFRQIEAKEKEHAERSAGESAGTRSALQLP